MQRKQRLRGEVGGDVVPLVVRQLVGDGEIARRAVLPIAMKRGGSATTLSRTPNATGELTAGVSTSRIRPTSPTGRASASSSRHIRK